MENSKKNCFHDFLSVSESVSVHGIHDLSAGRTRTVRVFWITSKNRFKCLLSQLRKLLWDLKIKNAFKIVFHHLISSKKNLTMWASWGFCIVTRAFLPVLGGAILQNRLNYIHHYLSWWQISWHGVWNRWSFFCSELLKVSRTLFSLHSSLPSQQSQIPSFTLLLKIQVGEDLQKKKKISCIVFVCSNNS